MRVVGGSLRGRRIAVAKGLGTRPTSERAREAIFDILQGVVEGSAVLDLFAGSGAMAIEALSRGARRAVLVETDPSACAAIALNIESLDLVDRAVLVRGDVGRFLSDKPPTGAFDLLFADPPYRIGAASAEEVMASAGEGGWLAAGARIVWEHHAKHPPDTPLGMRLVDRRRYGDTGVSFFAKGE